MRPSWGTATPGGYLRLEPVLARTTAASAPPDEEVTSTFMACNQAPLVAPIAPIEVANCAEAVEINAEVSDADGAVESYAWTVLSSASELTLEGAGTATVRIAAGEHLAGARLQLVATDNYGATSTVVVNVVFTGEGCRPLNTFYGVDPSSCSAIDIENTADDDNGGIVLGSTLLLAAWRLGARQLATDGLSIGPEDDGLFSRPTPAACSASGTAKPTADRLTASMGSCRPAAPASTRSCSSTRRPSAPSNRSPSPSPSDKAATTLRSKTGVASPRPQPVVGTGERLVVGQYGETHGVTKPSLRDLQRD